MNSLETTVAWLDCGTYWLSTAPQSSVLWDNTRKYRLTASKFASALGLTPQFDTPDDTADYILGIRKKTFTLKSQRLMALGVRDEPLGRNAYSKIYSVEVKEVGLAIPKYDLRIGSSVDGIVGTDGTIEIKRTEALYSPIESFLDNKACGWTPPPFYHEHIYDSHHLQMQGGLEILNRKWCDYVVISPPQNRIFIYRVQRDKNYWETFIYPGIQKFFLEKIEPRLEQIKETRLDPGDNIAIEDLGNLVNALNINAHERGGIAIKNEENETTT